MARKFIRACLTRLEADGVVWGVKHMGSTREYIIEEVKDRFSLTGYYFNVYEE